MATAKKTTATKKPAAKKPAAKKTAPTKATQSKASAAKRTTSKKSAAKKQPTMKSFRVSREDRAFTDFRITRQTVYWVILVAFIIFVQLWILKLQVEVVTLLDAQQSALNM